MAVFREPPAVPRPSCLSSLVKSFSRGRGHQGLWGAMVNQQQPLPHIKFQPQNCVRSGRDPHSSNHSGLGLRNSEPRISFRHEVGSPHH